MCQTQLVTLYAIPLMQFSKIGSFILIRRQELQHRQVKWLVQGHKASIVEPGSDPALVSPVCNASHKSFPSFFRETDVPLRPPLSFLPAHAALSSIKKQALAPEPTQYKDIMLRFTVSIFHSSSSTSAVPLTMVVDLNSLWFSCTYDQYCFAFMEHIALRTFSLLRFHLVITTTKWPEQIGYLCHYISRGGAVLLWRIGHSHSTVSGGGGPGPQLSSLMGFPITWHRVSSQYLN